MGISLCMIVKNEEDWVAGAVESVRPIVDEVIILDTGSTDLTPDRARCLGARVLESDWQESFAEARNRSLAAATEPWILVIDADERIAACDLQPIREAVAGDAADGYHLIQRNYVSNSRVLGWTRNTGGYEEGASYAGYVDNPLIRLFRNSREIRFHGVVHEIIDPTRLPHLKFASIPAVIHHYGKVRNEERVAAKQRLYLDLGLKKIHDDPANAKAYLDLGIQHQELMRHADACECFDRAFQMTGQPVALLYRAISQKQLGQYDAAADLLQYAIELGLDTPEVHLELGNIHMAQNDWEAAQAEYRKCLEMNPDNPVLMFNYGLVLRKTGDIENAILFYNRALSFDPTFCEPIVELAVLHLKAGRADEALSLLSRLSRPDAIAQSLIGAAHLEKNNLDEAQSHLEAALRRDRTLIDARLNLAQVYARRGDHARAARYMLPVRTS
jgi:tetratricopeptide (TPR) repeat protein